MVTYVLVELDTYSNIDRFINSIVCHKAKQIKPKEVIIDNNNKAEHIH